MSEETGCLVKDKHASFTMQWKIPKTAVDYVLCKDHSYIESSKHKLKFYNSSWFLKMQYSSYDLYNITHEELQLKLFLNQANIKENMLYARAKTTIKSTNEGMDLKVNQTPWQGNLKQVGMTLLKLGITFLNAAHYQHHGYLIIECEVEVKAFVDCYSISPSNHLPLPISEQKSLATIPVPEPTQSSSHQNKPQKLNNGSLFETGRYTDFTFKVGNKTFKTHRAILAVQSEYFETMFESGLKESHELESTVTDVDPEVFETFLKYLYTKETPTNINTIGTELIIAAHKYMVQDLVDICEEKLCFNIDYENCVELLAFANTNNCKKLKETVIGFIKPRIKQIIDTEAWEQLMVAHPKLVVEVLKSTI